MTSIRDTAFDKDAFKLAMGKCLHYLRVAHSMSLDDMGKKIGVTAQQIHKYETGETAVSSIHLHCYASVFKVPMGYFFGETHTGAYGPPDIDRKSLRIASEIVALPADIGTGIYHLAQMINRACHTGRKAA